MSRYLVDRDQKTDTADVHPHTETVELHGEDHLQALRPRITRTQNNQDGTRELTDRPENYVRKEHNRETEKPTDTALVVMSHFVDTGPTSRVVSSLAVVRSPVELSIVEITVLELSTGQKCSGTSKSS